MSNNKMELNSKDFIKSFDKYNDFVIDNLKTLIYETAQSIERDAKVKTPVDRGQLRASISTNIKKSSSQTIATVGTNVEYATFVHDGTGIYHIDGRGRKTPWVYRNKKGIFIKTSGQKPTQFLEKAFNKHSKTFNEEAKKILRGKK